MRKMQILSIALVALSFITALYAYFYMQMPEKMASHWNIEGQVDGYMDKGVALFLMPIISLVMLGLFYVIPMLDPLKKNYSEFQKEYDGMVAILVGFLYYVYLLTLVYSVGYKIDIMRFLAPAFGALFYYMGVVISRAKQNWFVGIRTPWTLSSENVWTKTHDICSKMFKVAAVIALFGAFVPQLFIASIILLVMIAIFSFVYSYLEFQKEKKK
ncbi:MAG: SdpI family protein [Candidatus Micrarchaeia archaeon]